jgi:biopolymer transport protein ExbB
MYSMSSVSRFRLLSAALIAVATITAAGTALAQAPAPAAEPAAVMPAIAVPAPAATEVVANPYGIEALWKQGDFIARGTLIILVIMSLGSWYIGVVKLIEQVRLMRDGREAPSAAEGARLLGENSAFKYLADEGIQAADHHEGTLQEQIDLNNWVAMSLQRSIDAIAEKQQNGLAFLATVGSTAPFVGLFGTVWGIYHALTAIGIAGQASIDKVAGPVGEALIMTAMGLAVAVPAVLGYNWLVRRNKSAMAGLRQFSGQLHMVLLAAGRKDVRKP